MNAALRPGSERHPARGAAARRWITRKPRWGLARLKTSWAESNTGYIRDASQHKSLAALELRVHIDTTKKIKRYQSFAFRFDENLMEVFRAGSLPNDWRQEPPLPSVQQLGDAWVQSATPPILAVPSVLIPDELNCLLNPRHTHFAKIETGKPTDFAFDPRLLKG
jgi:RES domain-containing protein